MGYGIGVSRSITHREVIVATGAEPLGARPAADLHYRSLASDHRASGDGLFVAIRGQAFDAHSQLDRLPSLGFRGVVGEIETPAGYPIPYYRVPCSRTALARLEQAFAGHPARRLRVFGVTGTNGKSTSVRLLSAILAASGARAGWMSTVTQELGGGERPQKLTTPEPGEIARGMSQLLSSGGTEIVLEVSSHALVQRRVEGIEFAGALFTNLTRDHLDFHGDFASYLQAKLHLFELCAPGAPAVFAQGGPVEREQFQLRGLRALTFGDDMRADAHPRRVVIDGYGTRGTLALLGETVDIESPLVGRHNLENILGAALLARASGIPLGAIARGIASAPPVRGRLEPVPADRGRIFVDYAHTPDALSRVLSAVREFTPGRLFVLFGCGGDRDRGKRPQMGEIAERLADKVFITSDNPRSERPDRIVDDIVQGMARRKPIAVEVDRRAALALALRELNERDVLVVAGKGHEREQQIGAQCFPFDDHEVILELLREEPPR